MSTVNDRILDKLFDDVPVPEGYKGEIVDGAMYIAPHLDIHWQTTLAIIDALTDRFGIDVQVFSDVRIDFPGHLNGFAPDVAKLRDGSEADTEGRWRYQDVEFVAEVIDPHRAKNDYGSKKTAYALAGVPYLIADPYQGKCHLFTQPKDGEYTSELSVAYGVDVDMTDTVLGLTLKTDEFPRD
ncbi:Uma2 family endonuclease [Streptomyces aurantiacus]|uniref:Uma2 family endonuclease n=1 Tax=Streptomyces aurantiacus TaxID=47760 RepID=UPI002790BF60|nr:Uma2 family endonuclease [Streptomyces aurantiacus]MDQ0775451.1 Uma2 family endonuclease [Streptomyces aurantiacus]